MFRMLSKIWKHGHKTQNLKCLKSYLSETRYHVFEKQEKDFSQHIIRRQLTYLHMKTNVMKNNIK